MIEALIAPVTSLLDKFIPDADEKARLAHDISTMASKQAYELAREQISVNREEAKHASIFVSGWRPSVGWLCCAGMGVNYICVPVANFSCALAGVDVVMPNLDISEMMPVLLGMLGLGAMRTVEKTKKVARD
jgi:phenylpyruvate tautomerase PptA (4-oxalocrotonate tautomerase family)